MPHLLFRKVKASTPKNSWSKLYTFLPKTKNELENKVDPAFIIFSSIGGAN